MYLPMDQAELVLKMLVDGMSVSAIERISGVHHGTILKLLVLAGERCEKIMGRYVRNVQVRDVEMDEVWAFIGKGKARALRRRSELGRLLHVRRHRAEHETGLEYRDGQAGSAHHRCFRGGRP
jgi:hypothetical protein